MRETVGGKKLERIRRVTFSIVASGLFAASAAYAKSSYNLIVVPPTDLPELVRQDGEAMFLHEEVDGSTHLYVEQDDGRRLAILDVTDPGHVKAEGSVAIDAPGPFDFVSTLGSRAEIVRFRDSHGNAVLDLHKAVFPMLKKVEGLVLQGPTMPLGADGFIVTSQPDTDAQPARDYQVVATANPHERDRVFDVKQVREELSNKDTGTTFLLTGSGLYLIRRPAMEKNRQLPALYGAE